MSTVSSQKPPRRWLRRIAVAFLVLAIGVPVAGYIALTSMDTAQLTSFLQQQVRQKTGRELYIKGGMDLSFGLSPAITLREVALSNPSWATQDALFYADSLSVRFNLLPLLSQELDISEITADGAKLALEKHASGKVSWQFEPKNPSPEPAAPKNTAGAADSAEPQAQPAFTMRLGPLVLRNTEVTYIDHAGQAPRTLLLPLIEAKAEGDVHLKATLTLGEFSGEIAIEGAPLEEFTQKPVLLDASFSGPRSASLAVKGKLKGFASKAAELYLRADMKTDSLAAFSSLTGSPLPESDSLALATDINGTFEEFALDKLEARFGDAEASGRARVSLSGATPFISATLNVPVYTLPEGSASQPAQAAATTPAAGDAPPSGSRVLPDIGFPTTALSALNADIEFTVGEINGPKISLNSLMGHLVLKGGILQVDPMQFKIGDDLVKGHFAYNTGVNPPAMRFSVAASGSDLGALLHTLDVSDKLKGGRFETDATLHGQGTSLHAMLPTMQGAASLVIEGAVLKEPRLQEATELANLMQGKSRSGDVALNCALGKLALKDGIGTPEYLIADTKHVRLHGEGTVDFPQELLALTFYPQPKDAGMNELSFPVKIKGSFADPSVKPDKAQAAFSAAKMLSGSKKLRALESFLGKGSQSDQSAAANVQHPCLEPINTPADAQGDLKASDVIGDQKEGFKEDFKSIEKDVKGIRDGLKNILGK